MNCLTQLTQRTPIRRRVVTILSLVVSLTASLIVLPDVASTPVGARTQDLDNVTISGRVADTNGAALPRATVSVAHASTGAERRVTTDEEGLYRVAGLGPGVYVARASFAGFAVGERGNLVTVAGQHVRLDFTLQPAGVTAEQVVVSEAGAPPVDTTRTVVGGTVTRDEIESLPLPSRSPLDFVFTLSGVTEEPLSTRDAAEDRDPDARSATAERSATTPEEAGAFALSGGAAYSNNITIDGLDNNDDRAARERFQPSLEAIEEVQVILNQFSAEYGRASGGRINLRTRGGSNDFRGRLFYFFRDESLNANTFNNNRRGLARLPLQQHNAGFTLSGPLDFGSKFLGPRRDAGRGRTFFFGAYERDSVLDSALIDALVPVGSNPLFPLPAPTTLVSRRVEPSATAPHRPAELAPFVERISTPLTNHILTARVDHKFTDAHNAAFLYQLGRQKNLRQFGGGLRLAESLQGRTRDADALSYSDTYVFSPSVINQLRAQWSRLAPSVSAPNRADSRPVVLITINDPLDPLDPADRSGTLVTGSSSTGASERRETRWQIQNSLNVIAGAHSVKMGGDAQRIRSSFVDLADAGGTYNFTSAGDFLANAPSRFRQRFGTASIQRNTYLGLFAQDEWRLAANLTISFGIRYEHETIIRDRNNFAPRVALAYDPLGTGRTVIRAGAGVFYNRAMLRTVDDFTLGRQVVEFDTDALAVTERRAFVAANLRFPEVLAADSPQVRELGTRVTNFSRRLDPRLRLPESYQANIGFEREVGGRFVLEANYTFNRTVHLWREFNANAPVLPSRYRDFTAYLLARDFANFRGVGGARPLYDSSSAGELVRFTNVAPDPMQPDTVVRAVEFGLPVSVFNLNSVSSTSALEAAHGALNELRPDPTRGQIEQLVSVGNSSYHGLTVEARRRFERRPVGLAFSLRAGYTLSRLIDDGIVNTSSALVAGDFHAERARSLLDRRHRFVFSGTFDAPRVLGRVRVSPILRVASGAPFNISAGGVDRNLDDVSNDRPVFNGDVGRLRARHPGEPIDARLVEAFALPSIGQTGNLPRNAGRGFGLVMFDLSVTREFRVGEGKRLRPTIEIDNVLNQTVFTFGAEFVNFNALRPTATAAQRQAFLDSFLVPTRTLRPRAIRLGLRFDF